MFKLGLVPNWVWMLIALAIGGGIYLVVDDYIEDYNTTVKKLSDETAAKDEVLKVNANLNEELKRRVKDEEDRNKINQDIDDETTAANNGIDPLKEKLLSAQEKRDELARKAKERNPELTLGPEADPSELTLTWQAYCKATRDPKCLGIK